MNQKTAVIIGAGPAGLTAAYELLDKTDIKPVIYEVTPDIGGISKTVRYKGNRIDIGGHRFFSKSEKVMRFWQNILPLQGAPARDDIITGHNPVVSKEAFLREIKSGETVKITPPDPELTDTVMLIRDRISRVFFLRKFFDYPISLSLATFKNLGVRRMAKIGASYIHTKLAPIKEEKTLEDFFINRFGREFYTQFFKSYSEKVWGVPCNEITAEWGTQRVKGVSISRALVQAFKSKFTKEGPAKKNGETSLVKRFLYPKLGAGHIWEELAETVKKHGAEIHTEKKVAGFKTRQGRIISVEVEDIKTGKRSNVSADYFFSSMPVQELINAFDAPPADAKKTADGLVYRDVIILGMLAKKLSVKNDTGVKTVNDIIPDHWIYMQDSDIAIGRLEIMNNWSPYMAADPNTAWMGLEYFANVGDTLWSMSDEELVKFSTEELVRIKFIKPEDVLDAVVIKMPKAYPAYFGTYNNFGSIRKFIDSFENLFLIGRNGMHKYNNMDHSMLTAMTAVENIVNNVKTKDNIWDVNTEGDYHEEKEGSD